MKLSLQERLYLCSKGEMQRKAIHEFAADAPFAHLLPSLDGVKPFVYPQRYKSF
jgi:hypothetical protein